MTTDHKYFLGAAAVIAATTAGILVAYPQLPATVPLHWNAHGNVDGWGPKWSLFLLGPGIMVAMVALFAALPWLSPKKFEVDSFRNTYLYIMIVTVALFAYVNLLVLFSALGLIVDVGRAVIGGVCLLIALLGNVLGKVRRTVWQPRHSLWQA